MAGEKLCKRLETNFKLKTHEQLNSFLSSVAKYIYSNHGNELHDLAIVFPNKRARLFFNKELAKLTDKPVFAPSYFTITDFIQQLSGRPIADPLTLLFALYEVYVDTTKTTETFDQFLFYCEMLLADFDDLDKYLVDAGMLYKNLSDLKDLEAYFDYLTEQQIEAIKQFWSTFANSKDSDEKRKFSSIWNILHKIYIRFNEYLEKENIAYEGSAYREAIGALKQGKLDINYSKVAFIGFNALNTCEKELFTYLQNQKRGLFFWDYDPYYINSDIHEAAYFLSDLIRKYPKPDGFEFETGLKTNKKNIKVLDIATNIGQAKALDVALQHLPEDWKDSPLKTAIALADESLLLPVLNSMPEEIEQVNISMGYPLKETRMFSLINAVVELQKNKRVSSKSASESFYHKDVLQLLQFGLYEKDSTKKDDLIKRIHKQNMVYISQQELAGLGEIYDTLFCRGIEPGNFVPYLLKIMEEVPRYMLHANTNVKAIEQEAAFRVITQLTRIADILSETKITYNFNSLTRLMAKLLEGASIPFTGEPLEGIQVMGILETRNIDFDNLIILSMNEGVFPKSGNVPSFIPYSLRKGFNMPTIEHQDAIFAYYFYRLLQRSNNIILAYTSSVTDNKSGEPSRFIYQLQFEKAFEISKETLSYNITPTDERVIVVEKSETTQKILNDKYTGSDRLALSPSAINTWLSCQLRFYYRYVAGIKEPETVDEEIEANTLGSILHKTIEELYKPYKNQVLSSELIGKILSDKKLIEQKVLEAFWTEYLNPKKELPENKEILVEGKNAIIKEVIEKYTLAILKYDKRIAPITIQGLEDKYYSEFTTENGGKILIGGIIDRIDEVNGVTRIIDYKTGQLKNSFDNIEELFTGDASKRNGAAFQTFLYSLVLANNSNNRQIEPGLYFVRNIQSDKYSSKINMKGIKRDISSLTEVIDEFEARLQNTINQIFTDQGSFCQTSDENYCGYCPYKTICGR